MHNRLFRVRRLPCLLAVLAVLAVGHPAAQVEWLDSYREPARRIVAQASSSRFAWERLAELGDTYGHRLSGSESLEGAIAWAAAEMKKDGLDNVRLDPVKVPHWVRGAESAEITAPRRHALVMLGLGNSVGTPPDGIQADVVVVRSFEELEAAGDRIKGRIVLFNVPFTTYNETVLYRGNGPSRAAARGAVAVLVRSVGPAGLRTPHTGVLRYDEGQPKIPAAAIAAEDADRLQRMQDRGARARVRLKMEAKFLPDAQSFNVIGEIRGRERPDEIVVVGGHIDSWDVGTGSTDDGGGCIAAWDALRLMKKLGLRPRRTVRVVLFTNEENGLRGGLDYRDRYREQLPNHVLMLESDEGVSKPTGFGFSGTDQARRTIRAIATLLESIGASTVGESGGGADIGPSVQAANIPSMSLESGGNYFLIHHTPADTVDKIDPTDLAHASAAIAVMAYVVADMPERLK
ncbi:MAG: M20/M25/M40 family metallo-hydrolase [Vicinamibacterales bacterium]